MDDDTAPTKERAKAELAEVRELATAETRVGTQLARAILAARQAGATWAKIGLAANVSGSSAHQTWRHLETGGKPGPKGQKRPRQSKVPTHDPAPLLDLVRDVVQAVLDGVGETYEEVLSYDDSAVHFTLPKRHLTIACAAHRINVIHHQRDER